MNMNTDNRNKKRKPQKKGGAGLVIGVIIVVGLIITAGVLFVLQMKQKEAKKPIRSDNETVSSEEEKEAVNHITYQGQKYELNRDVKAVLFLGVDKKGDMKPTEYPGEGGQSDCIILMALNDKEKTMQIFQVSRNTMTDIDVYSAKGEYLVTTKTQLTLQYAYGDGDKKSIWLMKKAVSNLIYGVPVNSAIAMNIDGLSVVNDMLGGVKITVPKDYTDIDPAFVEGSTLTLTGAQAEKYVRYRDITVTGSNMGRMERQTQFVMALMSQLKDSSQKDTELYSKLLTGANPYFVTDMSADEIQALAGYELEGEIQTFPGEEVAGEKHDEFYTDEEKLKEIVVKTFYKSEDM